MRAIDIRVQSTGSRLEQLKGSFIKNWKYYFQEALGLAIFMMSACFFSVMLESKNSGIHHVLTNDSLRLIIAGILMGTTALFIFYSPLTSPSGSHINPAVTITFLRLGKICPRDALFYILFQFAGGVLAVYGMVFLMGKPLTDPPISCVATVPGRYGTWPAAGIEFGIAVILMFMVLFTSDYQFLKKYTRSISACFVCLYVIFAGPVSGFGMNPARSFASALPAQIWTSFWIYMLIPVIGMLSAAELYLLIRRAKRAETVHENGLFRYLE